MKIRHKDLQGLHEGDATAKLLTCPPGMPVAPFFTPEASAVAQFEDESRFDYQNRGSALRMFAYRVLTSTVALLKSGW